MCIRDRPDAACSLPFLGDPERLRGNCGPVICSTFWRIGVPWCWTNRALHSPRKWRKARSGSGYHS
eukprot:3484694-Prorocentrum_lima.AAC.1